MKKILGALLATSMVLTSTMTQAADLSVETEQSVKQSLMEDLAKEEKALSELNSALNSALFARNVSVVVLAGLSVATSYYTARLAVVGTKLVAKSGTDLLNQEEVYKLGRGAIIAALGGVASAQSYTSFMMSMETAKELQKAIEIQQLKISVTKKLIESSSGN